MDSSENAIRETQRSVQIQKLENESLQEKIDLLRQEVCRLSGRQSDEASKLEQELLVDRIKLRDYERVAEGIDKVFKEMFTSDTEWQGVYIKNVYGVPQGPEKLQAMVHVLKRLEQKIKEVTLLRNEIAGLKKKTAEAIHDREVALQTISGGPQPVKNMIEMVYDRENALKESRRVIERMEQDYHILFKESHDLKMVIVG